MQHTAKKCIPKQERGDGTGKSKTCRKSNTSKVINQSLTQGHHIDAAKILLVSFLIKKPLTTWNIMEQSKGDDGDGKCWLFLFSSKRWMWHGNWIGSWLINFVMYLQLHLALLITLTCTTEDARRGKADMTYKST